MSSAEDTHACYIVLCQTHTTWSRATSHEWIYAWALARLSEMADWCAKYSCHSNSVSSQRGCFTKEKHVLKQVITALRRSVGLPGQFVTVWKYRAIHTHTQLLEPAAHARQGLIISYSFHMRTKTGSNPG